MQKVTILGSTGSIGINTLDVLRGHQDRFEVFALTANTSDQKLCEQIIEFNPRYAVMKNANAAKTLRERIQQYDLRTEILVGEQALIDVSNHSDVDTVVAAIVGAAGLGPTMAAVVKGKRVLLANKESLVMAGQLFIDAVRTHDAVLLPVDSEHNAIFQCLPQSFSSLSEAGVRRLLLTGSGGPFRDLPLNAFSQITPEQACAHPNWNMGKKISVDSATMMNKGLEFIEACWLFNASPEQIEIILHPQSIIHSMVEFVDGSVLAQMGQPDMRTPITHCLSWPNRIQNNVPSLNFFTLGSLSFGAPDPSRYPCLTLAINAMRDGGTTPAALNAANEVAVEEFLSGRIRFSQIAETVDRVMQGWSSWVPVDLQCVLEADKMARIRAMDALASYQYAVQ